MSKEQVIDHEKIDKAIENFVAPETYRIIDMSLEEVQRVGRSRWQKRRNIEKPWAIRLEAMMFPLTTLIFMGVLFGVMIFGLSLYWMILVVFPIGYGYWSSIQQSKLRNKASEIFLTSTSVRKNGSPDKKL
jgi:hypothetical protein